MKTDLNKSAYDREHERIQRALREERRRSHEMPDEMWLLAAIVILVAIVGSWLLGLPLIDPCFHLCG